VLGPFSGVQLLVLLLLLLLVLFLLVLLMLLLWLVLLVLLLLLLLLMLLLVAASPAAPRTVRDAGEVTFLEDLVVTAALIQVVCLFIFQWGIGFCRLFFVRFPIRFVVGLFI